MKKIYTMMMGMLFGGIALTASAQTVTTTEPTFFPENGMTLTYSEMEEAMLYMFGPNITWGDFDTHDNISYNENSDAFDNGSLVFDVYIDEEAQPFGQAYATIYDGFELDIDMNNVWDELTATGADFYLEIKIPEGCLFVGDDESTVNQAITLAYVVYADAGGGSVYYMEDPEVALDGYNVYFYWPLEIQTPNQVTTVSGILFAPNGADERISLEIVSYDPENEGYNDNNALTVDLEPYVEKYGDGKYQINIEDKSLVNGYGDYNKLITWSDTMKGSGIGSISDEIGNAPVYNLQGVKVNGNKLNNGIYIINGKKVVVRK